jgi:hypothetical protein
MIKFVKTLSLTVAIAYCACAGAARADETWICAAQGTGKDATPSMTRYRVQGDILKSDGWEEFINGAPYRIVENNQYGLVAVAPVAGPAKEQEKQAEIGAVTILIDKITGHFSSVRARLGRSLITSEQGTCVHV